MAATDDGLVQVELGGYIGYSTILFGAALQSAGGRRYISLERNPEFAAVASSLVDLAGLAAVVQVVVGPSADSLRRLHSHGHLDRVDLLFLDHYKPAYLTDLQLCEQLGLIRPGVVLAADNVIKPGNPPYLEYVRSSAEAKKKRAAEKEKGETTGGTPGFTDRYARQYEKREGVEKLDTEVLGDPSLVYASRLVESFEPTGVPVSPSGVQTACALSDRSFRMALKLQNASVENLDVNRIMSLPGSFLADPIRLESITATDEISELRIICIKIRALAPSWPPPMSRLGKWGAYSSLASIAASMQVSCSMLLRSYSVQPAQEMRAAKEKSMTSCIASPT